MSHSVKEIVLAPVRRAALWLRDVPIGDPLDRRNAPVMQVLFLFSGLVVPALWAYHILMVGMPQGGKVSLSTSLVVATLQLFCVAMIRRGHFRRAIRLYLSVTLLCMLIEYLHAGFYTLGNLQIEPLMTLMISALVLGRGALWATYGMLQVISLSGFAMDAYRLPHLDSSFANLLSVVSSQFVAAVILDRTVHALRESLAESQQRGRELVHEMQARERAQSQLVHAQKLETTGRLASGIAHDFGNVLHVITAYVSGRNRILALPQPQMEDEVERAFEAIGTAAERGTQITRKLLAFSRHDIARPVVFDAVAAVQALQPMLRQLFPPSVRIRIDEPGAARPACFDRGEFDLMVLNLAANARDAMPDGGEFSIALPESGDGMTTLVIADTGHGMDAATRARIFDAFFTTKGAAGTGLGLAVIRDVIGATGGDIRVDSEPGRGSRFTVRLSPTLPAPAAAGG